MNRAEYINMLEERINVLEADIISRERRRKEILDFLQDEIGTGYECKECGHGTYHIYNRECEGCGAPFPFIHHLAFKLHASHSDREDNNA